MVIGSNSPEVVGEGSCLASGCFGSTFWRVSFSFSLLSFFLLLVFLLLPQFRGHSDLSSPNLSAAFFTKDPSRHPTSPAPDPTGRREAPTGTRGHPGAAPSSAYGPRGGPLCFYARCHHRLPVTPRSPPARCGAQEHDLAEGC